jgi:hypothetical protein
MGKQKLAEVCGAGIRTVEQWGLNNRTPQGPATPNLALLCRLYGVKYQVYARAWPGSPPLPLNHVVVSSPDGWWLLPKGGAWLTTRKPFAGGVGGLLPAGAAEVEGYKLPAIGTGLPEVLNEALTVLNELNPEDGDVLMRGLLLGLRPVAHLLPEGTFRILGGSPSSDRGNAQDRVRAGLENLRQR